MRKDITITAETRDTRGKNEARRLRRQGRVPAVLYGGGGASVPVSVSPREINRILHSATGHNTIFDVEVGNGSPGEKTPVMIVDWLHDPVKENLLHVDLKRIDLSKRLRVKVPVHLTGEPFGVKTEGGMLELITREIEVECLPGDIPEHFTSDVTELKLGANLRAAEVSLGPNISLVSPGETVIAHVVVIRVVEEAPAAVAEVATEVPAEPEVIKKGKKEEEAEPPPEDKGKKPPEEKGKKPPEEKGKKK